MTSQLLATATRLLAHVVFGLDVVAYQRFVEIFQRLAASGQVR
jgi:hypothetical protein